MNEEFLVKMHSLLIFVGILYILYLIPLVYGLLELESAAHPADLLLLFIIPYCLHFIGLFSHFIFRKKELQIFHFKIQIGAIYPLRSMQNRLLKIVDILLFFALVVGIFAYTFPEQVSPSFVHTSSFVQTLFIAGLFGVFACIFKVCSILTKEEEANPFTSITRMPLQKPDLFRF
jgi:hypothetical protein